MNPEEEADQEELNEAEEREQGGLEDVEVPEMGRPSLADVAAIKAANAAEKTGRATRGLLEGIGAKIEAPAPPSDDLSDLFEGPNMETDNDVYIKDVVSVEEEDVFGEGGSDMSDILEVSEEDVMGDEDVEGGYEPKVPVTRRVVRRSPQATAPPSGLYGVQ